MSRPPLVDAAARAAIATRLDANVVVEAAAGTGKTSELVRRIVAVLGGGHTTVERIVAVTFTEKAAGELKLRLRAGLEDARRDAGAEPRGHLEHALAHLEDARVSTIHGFCADLLRERPVEARTDPQFEVLAEPDSRRLYEEGFGLWLQETLDAPPEGVRRSLRRPSGRQADDTATGRLARAGATLVDWRDMTAPWRRESFDRDGAIDELVDAVFRFAELTERCRNGRDLFYRCTAPARRLRDDVRIAERVGPRDHDGLESSLIGLLTRDFREPGSGFDSNWPDAAARAAAREAHGKLLAALQNFQRAADADLAALLQKELAEPIARYERLKLAAGRLDFLDLLLRARDLLRRDAAVRADFQRRFTHIFVDEFQDTDPVQAEILLLLAADDPAVVDWRQITPSPGKIFIVGDPKQSIYRFRRADVGVYHEVRDLLVARGALALDLTTSFRPVPAIQRVVNHAFEPLMNGDHHALQAGYVPLSPHREDVATQPSVVALPVPRPYGWKRVAMRAIDESLPDAVGAFVHWLVNDSGWTVTERDDPTARVPVAPGHVCILFRRLESFFQGDITRQYVAALEARDLPHLLVGGRSFHAREEVGTLRAALSGIEWPDSELAVFATLRGSLFGIGDEELLSYRARYGRLHPFRVPRDEVPDELAPVVEALEALRGLHVERNRRPVAETINRLLHLTRAHAGFALRPSGEQALANVLHIAELARLYEASGGISFRGFVAQLEDEAERGQASDAPILEEGSEGVRLMTVHKAKGLEFPVVVLADMTASLAINRAGRYLDPERGLCAVRIAGWAPADLLDHEDLENRRDAAEGVRLAYVAATRARDLLVVPAVGDLPFEKGWFNPLNRSLYPPAAARDRVEEAHGAPAFGRDTVLARPSEERPDGAMRPGRYRWDPASDVDVRPADGNGIDVTWWDPASLALGAASTFGIRRQELLDKTVDQAIVDDDAAEHAAWRARHQDALGRGERPTARVQSVGEFAAEIAEGRFPGAASELAGTIAAIDVTTADAGADPDRPAGPRFGILVHAILAHVPLDGDAEAVRRTASRHGRVLGATAEEVDAAAGAVGRALALPVIRRAHEAARRGRCRREAPVSIVDETGTLVDGFVDLAFEHDEAWCVVDFKTDREIGERADHYEQQVRLYAGAIARATGLPTSGILVRI